MSARRISWRSLHGALCVDQGDPSVFTAVFGASMQSTSLKGVHVMNDVMQTIVGKAPAGNGDLLCHVVRLDHAAEDHSDATLRRALARYRTAYSRELSESRVRSLRRGAAAILTHDGGVYRPGDRMCSTLGTCIGLQGSEGFRRFQLGALLSSLLPEAARDRLRRMVCDVNDPVSRGLLPLVDHRLSSASDEALTLERSPSDLDRYFGGRLSVLLEQPLTKPAVLRLFVQAATLWLVLRVYGVGEPGGRPRLLFLTDLDETLRDAAHGTLARARRSMMRELAVQLAAHPAGRELLDATVGERTAHVALPGSALDDPWLELLVEARRSQPKKPQLVWPDECTAALARRAGFWRPLKGRRRPFLTITPTLLEALVLMYVPDGERRPWRGLWDQVEQELGIVVGARPSRAIRILGELGLGRASVERLAASGSELLDMAVASGVARRLPDSGAEAGGGCSDLP